MAKKKLIPRTRPHVITLWLSDKEQQALDEAVTIVETRTGKTRQRSECLRAAVAKFVAHVKLSCDFVS